MPTFAGVYLKEPSDFYSVVTEQGLIELLDDPQQPDAPSASSWAELSAEAKTAFALIANPIILSWEGVVNAAVRAGGYLVPADLALDPIVKELALGLVHIQLQLRHGLLTSQEAESQRNAILSGPLKDIRTGDLPLNGAPPEAEPSGLVHRITSSERILSRELLEDF